ncbi:MAG: TrkH family potassium uptake protein [Clostridia bacterium]|nr:TrkH family potassium uptake protein [Clostridia bacterium]
MNFAMIRRTLGFMLLFLAIFLLVPLVTSLIYWEKAGLSVLIAALLAGGVGWLCILKKPKKREIYAREGFVIVALCWIVLSLFGALPFWLSGEIPSYVDALFETVSGFTTTGATILPTGEALEALPKCLLMWRSFTHWVGGMGVLVFVMAFLPLSGAGNLHMMRAESTGADVGKIVPKMRQTAKILYLIYAAMTTAQFLLLLCGGMSVFEALNTAFSTAGTGGFGFKGDSMASYNSYLQIVTTVFMLLFSINFNSYFLLLRGKCKDAFNAEVRTFLLIVLGAILLISLNIFLTEGYGYGFAEALKDAAFSVASVISTTGFVTEDFNLWPTLSKTVLVVLMFIGACAGSTGGGIKVSRIMVLCKGGIYEVGRMIHPKQVKKIAIDGRKLEHEVVRSINAYLVAFILVYVISLLLISLEGYDLVTSFTAVAATVNNVGPGLGAVGPSGNFAFFNDFSKLVLVFDMLAGRLEIFPILILFSPRTWKK